SAKITLLNLQGSGKSTVTLEKLILTANVALQVARSVQATVCRLRAIFAPNAPLTAAALETVGGRPPGSAHRPRSGVGA
ncbi:hypothetical protein E2I00_005894, partial [Balaenoptera physalus]